MSTSPENIFNVAEKLAATEQPCEASLRSACSRAYYAAYHHSLARLPNAYQPSETDMKGARSHDVVISALTAWGNSIDTAGRTQARLAAKDLRRLKDLRKAADYDLNNDFSVREMHSSIVWARQILRNLK